MKLNELASQLNALDGQLTKATDEILAKLDELQAALSNVEIPQEATDALASLQMEVQKLDDIIPG